MPYLYYLNCEKCGDHFSLDLDHVSTIESYILDGRGRPQLNQATFIWDYLIYSCANCKQTYKYTYRDVERRVREHFMSLSTRYAEYFSEIDKHQNNEEARRSGEFFVKVEPKVKKRIMDIYKAKG